MAKSIILYITSLTYSVEGIKILTGSTDNLIQQKHINQRQPLIFALFIVNYLRLYSMRSLQDNVLKRKVQTVKRPNITHADCR